MEKETSKQAEIKALSIADVISSALPCPFCGETPTVDKSYMPSTVEITCNNHDCHARPSVYESVRCVENKGDTVTYSPMFEWHWQSVLDKWNTRHCVQRADAIRRRGIRCTPCQPCTNDK